jgi:hypothetical protein
MGLRRGGSAGLRLLGLVRAPHATPYTLHATPYTLHPTRYALHATPYRHRRSVEAVSKLREHTKQDETGENGADHQHIA